MGMRKTAIVAAIALAGVIAPLQQGVSFAQGAPGAMATEAMVSSLSPADKDALMKKLEEARKHDKIARAGWSQEPLTQATYDKKIDQIKALMQSSKAARTSRSAPPTRRWRHRIARRTEISLITIRGRSGLGAALDLFLIVGDVKYVQQAMQHRREHQPDYRDQRESAVERVDRREDFAGVGLERINRTHAAEDHRRVEQSNPSTAGRRDSDSRIRRPPATPRTTTPAAAPIERAPQEQIGAAAVPPDDVQTASNSGNHGRHDVSYKSNHVAVVAAFVARLLGQRTQDVKTEAADLRGLRAARPDLAAARQLDRRRNRRR